LGIESDADASYKREIVNELIAEVIQMCPVEIARHRAQLDKLDAILASRVTLS
jgi:VIT1/CCC1 family predicted Fe2+/Mn2+ transporter